MKTKAIRRIICVLIVACIFSAGLTAQAAQKPSDSAQYSGTDGITASLSINSIGLANCSGTIYLTYSSYSADMTIKLERYTGGSWVSVQTWSDSDVTSLHKSRYVTHGYYYRVVASATVYNSSGKYVESPSATSSSVYY